MAKRKKKQQTKAKKTIEKAATKETPKNKSVDEEKIIKELETKNKELQDKYLRLYSDFDNYKKRMIRERLDTLRLASKDLLTALLPVLDDFDRARASSKDGEFDQGVGLIYNKLYHVLSQQGLQPMESTNQPFDPDYHEAITKLPAPSKKMKGVVMDTVEKGYFLKDRILRYAKVVVAE